jgi:selenophosphate synthetase-related protein
MPGKLERIVSEVQGYWGLRRKQPIGKLVTILQAEGFQCPHVLSSIGEDAAAIDLGGQNLILLTTDAVVPELAASNPYVAGYAAIMVNVNDIYAAAGRPIVAMVNVAFTAMEAGVQMMRGICEAGRKFHVQVVRGHTTPDAPANGVSASICGVVKREDYVSAGGAQSGDSLILAVDLQGRPSPNYQYGWDTTVLKSSEAVLHRCEAMRILGAKKLLHASKDLSNGGIIGTLLLLLEYARRGATVDLASIPRPSGMDLSSWLKMYISTGYVVTSDPKQAQEVLEIFRLHDMTAAVIGSVDDSLRTVLQLDGERRQIFDFAKDSIVAPPKPPRLRCSDGTNIVKCSRSSRNLGVNKRSRRL